MNNTIATKAADNLRVLIAAMVEKANSGHPGGAMGATDFIHTLYSEFLNWDPDDMTWFNRDRFFLDPGHMSPMLYSMLTLTGNYSTEDLQTFRQWGSPLAGHPEICPQRGIENTSGPLGQGHVMAIGAAIAERFLREKFGSWMEHKTFAFISDGGIQEEISQGGGRLAGHLKLGNLIMFYDSNDIQLSTTTSAVTTENTAAKYEAWGWHVQTIEGNDIDQIRTALKNALAETNRPSLIIGKTIMGKGCVGADGENKERMVSTHGQPLSKAGVDVAKTIIGLGGNPDHPFSIYPEVAAEWQKVLDEKRKIAAAKKAEQKAWEAQNPELAAKWHDFISGKLPKIDFANIEQKENAPTRNASANVLGYFAEHVENMIVASADLANSDKTDGFLKKTHALLPDDFSGQFLHAGVAELTMAVMMNGMAIHGGVHVACGTFFVFSDYMKPAVRMSALQELPVIYIWSHDSYRVGEDGPTHQPIEQYATLCLSEKVKNHHGKNSILVLRPADGDETNEAYKMALENTNAPTALVLSRQNIKALPALENSNRKADAQQAQKGGYIVLKNAEKPDVVMIANGSEVSTLCAAATLLKERKNITSQVVSMISTGLFDAQPETYKKTIIPTDATVYGLIAGLPTVLEHYINNKGKIHGIDHFGYSAPAEVLDEKFGFTAEAVYNDVCTLIK
ncbi:MAG: transketolase [Bacteroidales bacterium]|nr:transketolase [Bacteroidales bacterium]